MGGLGPLTSGNKFRQVSFDLHRIFILCPAKTSGQPLYVSINNHTRNLKRVSQYHISRFSANPRQCDQFVQSLRDLAGKSRLR